MGKHDDASLSHSISPVTEILQALQAGQMVVLVDEEDRENEGDLVMAAEFVTPEAINFYGYPRARLGLPDIDAGPLPAA